MKVFVAGATGAVGAPLVRVLVDAGHEVVGTTRSPAKLDRIRAMGAEAVVMEGLDAEGVRRAVLDARPEVVVHQMTDLTGFTDVRRFAVAFASTNRLRTGGTDHLLAAAREAGTSRFVAQSFASWPYERSGGWVKTEEDPFDPDAPAEVRSTLDAIRHLERAVLGAEGIEGIVLRYGGFYGPGTSMAAEGSIVETVRRRRFPIAGPGTGVWSFVHVEDAASATLLAIQRGVPGVYNVVDDEPAPVSVWLPALAEIVGAKPPRRVPAWVGRLLAGEHVLVMLNEIRGASNAKARRELGWTPRYPSWRDGFRATFGGQDLRSAAA
ncbi:MAG TPA: NAD(P)-dependent oxidoreductase [Actinomycetota bacterium]